MNDPSFFGYGSLVNLRTHDYTNARAAKITGWRRIWRSLKGQSYATLSVTPCATTTLAGVLADVPQADWSALDLREKDYVRQSLNPDTAIYEVQLGIIIPPTPHPILRSYLDVVTQGYLDHFGESGVADFFATTDNWGPIFDDRRAPHYPRHQQVSDQVTALTDHHLTAQM